MRKLFTLVALLIGGIMAYATPDALQIELNTGEPVVFHLSHSPEVSFVGDIVKIKSSQPDSNVEFEIDDVKAINFIQNSSAEEIDVSAIIVRSTPTELVISKLPEKSVVGIYSIDGRCVASSVVTGEYTVDKSSLPHGVYVVRANNFVTKTTF